MRDPHKYDWLPPEPPHVPRREQVSATNTALSIVLAVIAAAVIAVLTFAWPIVEAWLRHRS